MALMKRYALHTIIAATFLYLLYSLSFPYQQPDNTAGGRQQHNDQHQQQSQPPGQGQKPLRAYDWANIPMKHPIRSMTAFPTAAPRPLPKVQFDFKEEDATAKNIRERRRNEVKRAFEKCWTNYRMKAWMHDELSPISGEARDPFGGWAATLIDALDTLLIMGLKEEFTSAIKDVERVNFGRTPMDQINVFETNIRHLGGLLAAYELSGEDILLKKAKEVGDMIYHAFDTPNHMPVTRWDFNNAGSGKEQIADENVLVAEIGSLTMEFSRLSQLTGDHKWYDATTRITKILAQQQGSTKLPGLWPIVINARKADFFHGTGFTLGAMADSAYEYLAKTYALLGGVEPLYQAMYEQATDAAVKHLVFRPMTPEDADILAVGSIQTEGSSTTLNPELQHLGCFAGGMFALGGKLFDKVEHVTIGRKLANGCVWAYKASPAGIMPEVSHLHQCPSPDNCTWSEQAWRDGVTSRADLTGTEKDPLQNIANLRLPQGFTAIDDRRYILRPEAIESVFILYRITGEQQWQAAAWDMFTAIQRHTETDIGNAALSDVSTDNPPKMDSMESFWMAETLKYFYLIFSDPDVISLDDYVFNTEAHPFKISKPSN
ncbi:glycoside hydrolase family 47 protein [Aaosphaeria arxii CBS 175.79]|uniref:alpha-1,2-Mannosidase n=1 Tax=Aaosphaeria arxii CBS 175.79 TaxID=1450172 RepID=A0A6A5Y1T4_9PLEO|nr:glycoside hydrolase family 47 protein [Aaosphaeria arxii CBS 175.79]KAF2018514.1 glycoside hydrolase family 47 protein [Aaosphaeria arxii CBS 175.79]